MNKKHSSVEAINKKTRHQFIILYWQITYFDYIQWNTFYLYMNIYMFDGLKLRMKPTKTSKTNTPLWNWEEEIAESLKKTPEQVISENLKSLIWQHPTRKLSEEQRKKYKKNDQLVTKTSWGREVDYISPSIYLKLVDEKVLKQNYKYFEEILRASWWIKKWKHINEVKDWWNIYRQLESMNIPKGYMATCVTSDKLKREEWFCIPIYNPTTKTFELFSINRDGYKRTVLVTNTYHISLWLPKRLKTFSNHID
jgi:hypothetical protein